MKKPTHCQRCGAKLGKYCVARPICGEPSILCNKCAMMSFKGLDKKTRCGNLRAKNKDDKEFMY